MPDQIVQAIIEQAQDTSAHGSISSSGLWDFAGVNYNGKLYGSYILHNWSGILVFDTIQNGAHKVQRIATDTPPQEYDLPLADGWTVHRRSVYFKTQDNVVTVYFQVKTAVPKRGEFIIATLPDGFRPSSVIGGIGYSACNDQYFPADTKIYENGEITSFNVVGESEYCTGFFTFVASENVFD